VCWSAFFVSAITPEPLVFFDSPVDSGYSVDNLAPSVPTGLALTGSLLAWDEPVDADFLHFAVYGAAAEDMAGPSLIDYTVVPSWDVQGAPFPWYHVTAVDHSGNESGSAGVPNSATGVGTIELIPGTCALHAPLPNPFTEQASIGFDVPGAGPVSLRVYDVSGRVVATLIEGEMAPGRYSSTWSGRGSGSNLAPGVYFVRLSAGGEVRTRKVVRVRE